MIPFRAAMITCSLLFGAQAAMASPYAVTGIWTGRYDCAQGDTALELDVSLLDPHHLQALFYFHAAADNPNVPNGCFLMQGEFDDARQMLLLSPTAWLLQPPGYVWVGLTGSLGGDGALRGVISGPGCSDFSLTRGTSNMPSPCRSSTTIDIS